MKPGSQTERLLRYLRDHHGATSLEITLAIDCAGQRTLFDEIAS
jgi:hypothetical protein